MKLKVQAQHILPGDVTGSGETVAGVVINSIHWPSSKIQVSLIKYENSDHEIVRTTYWGKYTEINVERK